jgi:hypothetical protein
VSIAERWRSLAELFPEACFCGRPPVGQKKYRNGGRQNLCSHHILEALMRGVSVEIGRVNDN